MFDDFPPQSGNQVQIMDNRGQIIHPRWKPDLSDEKVLNAYKLMLFERTADTLSISYQRQGRMYTYPPNLGQEAIHIGAGLQMTSDDWLVPAFRELGAWLQKGATLKDLFLYWCGFEEGSMFPGASNMLPINVPIASQFPHAVGIGFGLKQQKKAGVVFAFCGDGGTSEGDFHEALNFAGVWKVPVIFIVQNNQFAISVPVSQQTASLNLAVKAVAYGLPGMAVDGNDFFAVYASVQEAVKRARAGNGAVLLEMQTFRRGAHTTSDDPSLYRSSELEREWEERDPLKRLQGYLQTRGLWTDEQEQELLGQYKLEIDEQFRAAESHPPYVLADAFRFLYRDMPDHLKRQQADYEKYLNWKEAQSWRS